LLLRWAVNVLGRQGLSRTLRRFFARSAAIRQADLHGSLLGSTIRVPTEKRVSGIQAGDAAMVTKHAVVLAIILGIASGLLATKKQYGIDPAYDVYGNERLPGQSSAGPAAAAPIVVVQGRCFNGHCY
jgi:hypothetical protein